LQQLRRADRLTKADYMVLAEVSCATAKRDVDDLAYRGLVEPRGSGRGANYVAGGERLNNGSNGSGDGGAER
jgi:hypothetical protein